MRKPTARANPPPKHLQAETRKWWVAVTAEYELEAHHVRLLTLAAEAWDRCQQARKAIAKDGLCYTDSRGSPRPHPAVGIERDARIAFARLLRELDLDVSPPRPSARPPAIY